VIPIQVHHVNHKLEQTIAQLNEDDERFLDQIRAVKTVQNFQELKEKFYNFRMAIDSLNENLDKDLSTLR
jgi:phosphoglycerate-specific signal transduction histidine kinase